MTAESEAKKRGPKLSPTQIQTIQTTWKDHPLQFWRRKAREWGVVFTTLQRVHKGETYGKEREHKKLGDETKPCIVCRKPIKRRNKRGKRRSAKQWSALQTCGWVCGNITSAATRAKKRAETIEGHGSEDQGGIGDEREGLLYSGSIRDLTAIRLPHSQGTDARWKRARAAEEGEPLCL